jgi:hypothetical protein
MGADFMQDAHRLKSQLLSAAKILRDADTRGNLTAINHALGKKVPMQSELNVKVVQWMKP